MEVAWGNSWNTGAASHIANVTNTSPCPPPPPQVPPPLHTSGVFAPHHIQGQPPMEHVQCKRRRLDEVVSQDTVPSTAATSLTNSHNELLYGAPLSLHPHMPQLSSSFSLKRQAASGARYRAERILGKGSFGTVFKAAIVGTGRSVAIKTVKLRDAGREVQVLRTLRGSPNIVTLLGTFVGKEEHEENRTLNLVMEFVPDTLQRIIKHNRQIGQFMDIRYTRLYMHQLLRGLACLTRNGIVHRDLKPANLLVEPQSHRLKMCDFGTAKLLDSQDLSQPYVCSRYYRAPELILSVPDYTVAVDLWSAGCVLAEMVIGQPLFAGRDGVDQLQQIVDILGTPSATELHAMNPQYSSNVSFQCRVEPLPWDKVLGRKLDVELVDLVGRFLQFDPARRPHPMEAMAAPFFDELRRDFARHDPFLFAFTAEELSGCPRGLREKLLPLATMGAINQGCLAPLIRQ